MANSASLTARAQSALADLHHGANEARFTNGSIQLEEIPLLGMVRLQGPGLDYDFCEQVSSRVMPLPAAGKFTSHGAWRCHWLTPNEWLFVTAAGTESAVLNVLAPALTGRAALATQISDSRLAIAIRGSSARALLSKGCALDFHGRRFMVGQTANTRFAKVAVLVSCVDVEQYELYVDRSQARYLWTWLVDAAGEFSV